MICAGRTEITVSDNFGINYTFNVAMNESVTSFYGWGWKDFLNMSNSQPGDFIMFQMTNNVDTPIKVGACKSATMSQISKVQADTSTASYIESFEGGQDHSESSDGEPDQGCMIFYFIHMFLTMMQNAYTLNNITLFILYFSFFVFLFLYQCMIDTVLLS
jgi:hypothetical protein